MIPLTPARPLVFRRPLQLGVPLTIFDGPTAADGLVQAVLKGGVEPVVSVAKFLGSLGMYARSSLAIGYGYFVHALWLPVAIDRLN